MTTVAIQGELGAFSHQAALQLVRDAEMRPCRSFEELFGTVASGEAALGIVPVENTLAGAVQRTMDLLVEHTLHAVGETRVPIRLCLTARPGVKLADLGTVASHPVALQQCHRFFQDHPHLVPTAAYDTAGSVKELMEGGAAWDAAVGSALAARLYGANVLAENIEDHEHNYTRFLAVAREPVTPPEEGAKTSLAFRLGHTPGSLHQALGCFARHSVDLSRIESRPIAGRPWEYRFYVDARGASPEAQGRAVEELRATVDDVRVLGRYAESPWR
jgi:prephenate dehydratase